MNWSKITLALMAAALLPATLCAETQAEDVRASTLAPDATLTPRSTSGLLEPKKSAGSDQLVVYFVVLLALAGGGFYFLKRGLPLRGKKNGESRLQLLETKMLGNRQFLVVVNYDDNKMLIGVGPGQIQYLCPLDSADDDLEKLAPTSDPAFGKALA